MKSIRWPLYVLAFICAGMAADKPTFDPELAKRLGADEHGMKMYVLCILKTGPNDAAITGKQREEIFAGHFANIERLADEGKLAVAGPFGKNDKRTAASTSSTSPRSKRRRSWSCSIRPSKQECSSPI